MIKKHSLYAKPRKLYDKKRIDEEVQIKKAFGLKNKREIWKAEAKISTIRRRAKDMITAPEKEKEQFFAKLCGQGFSVKKLSDALALTKENVLQRRLQTIVYQKKLAPTLRAARQLITHKKVMVSEKIVNVPSYNVPVILESEISIKQNKRLEVSLDKTIPNEAVKK